MVSVLRIVMLSLWMMGISVSHAESKTATSILLFGDSIVAGYGLPAQDALPVQLEKALHDLGREIKVINGGVSGDTTSGGRGRLEWTLKKYQPSILFIALGGNDVLRGLSPAAAKENLEAMILIAQKNNVPVILSQVQAPANLGVEYMNGFNQMYPDLAAKHKLTLYPFLLEGVFGNPALMQSDTVHPNAEGAKQIAVKLAKFLLGK